MAITTDDKLESKETQRSQSQSSHERPPSYSANEAEQPPLELKLDLGSIPPSVTTVTRDQCIAHLKFLAVLADLRDAISSDDGLFGIFDSEADRFPDLLNEARARIREKRWAVYVARAVHRYTTWWSVGLPRSRQMATIGDLESVNYGDIVRCDTLVAWSPENLPPLDILMVWHSHSLNPRSFLEDCIRYGKMSTWRTGFPWKVIDSCIDNQTMEYRVSEEAQQLFEKKLQFKWNNLDNPPVKEVECPRCKKVNAVPWTEARFGETVANAFRFGDGYADNNFEKKCLNCQHIIDHDRLKVAKFRKDLQATLQQNLPMPGSFTNLYGVPEGSQATKNNPRFTSMMFPTRLVKATGKDLSSFTDGRVDWCQNIDQLRERLEEKLRDRTYIFSANGGVNTKILRPTEKVHFRRMMSRYWDNLDPFALDLVGAVVRQGTFVEKMDQIDWLHSPAVFETMDRIIKKYEVFFKIMLDNPNNMAVPTLDVDLAWHTHQLSPPRYYNHSISNAKPNCMPIFIDHDDKVDEEKLSDGFAWTSKMYRRATDGGIYSECTCWYCEATRTPDLYDRLIAVGSVSRARDAADQLHSRPDISSDPNKNPHISAHNAIRPASLYAPTARTNTIQFLRLKSNYQKAARRAEKRAGKSGRARSGSKSSDRGPVADPYYMPYAYGYPIMVPCYAPYMADPCINSDVYACNPGCMNITVGAAGNCCAGTCSKFFLRDSRNIEWF
ncbi:unnamed protein product [Penicillium salamii]|uniref:Uncharacterized protein n=1 Tax=Penicillium salamii TaxID=1612424 RepID=A0A9W4NBV3_9EURO|nr:unnamed protein product [Penicillium salamii]